MKENSTKWSRQAQLLSSSAVAVFVLLTIVIVMTLSAQKNSVILPAYVSPAVDLPITPAPTYNVLGLRATARAIAAILPTATPILGISPEKQAGFQSEDLWDRAISTAAALYPPPPDYEPPIPTSVVRLTPWPTMPLPPHRATGNGTIYDASAQDDPYCSRIGTVNYWIGQVRNQTVDVCAGVTKDGTEHGALVVWLRGVQGQAIDFYITPSQTGALRILDANGEQVTLQSAAGPLFTFDLTTRQWVSPPPLPTPSLSVPPLPTLSPALSPIPSVPPLP